MDNRQVNGCHNFVQMSRTVFNLQNLFLMTGVAYGSLEDTRLTFKGTVKLKAGINKISLLSSSMGLAVSSSKL